MKRAVSRCSLPLAVFLAVISSGGASPDDAMVLSYDWRVASSQRAEASGEVLSSGQYEPSGWYDTSVPATVFAVLIENGVHPDPYYGKNLAKIPGVWPSPFDTSAMPMPPASPFRDSWWYRTEFFVPGDKAGKTAWLEFDGINYDANIWLNGEKAAGTDRVFGTYRTYRFDVTDMITPGKDNVLAVEVFAPRHRDLAFTWVDWNPAPPDRDMGIYRDVRLRFTGKVAVRNPVVVTDLDTPGNGTARLTVGADLVNASAEEVSGELKGRIGHIAFSKEITLGPKQALGVELSPEDFPELDIEAPELWWPFHLGEQKLHRLDLEFTVNKKVSDRASTRFGIREIDSEFTENGDLVFTVNGRRILIRGAGWAPEMTLRQDPRRLRAEIRYVKEMNLNTIRLEGKYETDLFFDLCDEEGILVLAGWCCCHHWERWRKWDDEDFEVAYASQQDQVKRLRSHPSMLAWMNGSDNPPPAEVEKNYLEILDQCMWQNPAVSSATEAPAEFSGPSGVKMNGPYEWVAPNYWYEDTKHGGAWGFNTETSPGPAVPPTEGLMEFLPPEHLWPIDGYWNFHAGRNMFGNVKVFTEALNKRYGKARDVDDYAWKAQAMTYEGERAMFEAFGRNKYVSTGVIQWMLNDAWPSIIWHLYDFNLRPAGGYFGSKKACEPLHVQYSYDDRSVAVVNGYYESFEGLTVKAVTYDPDMNELWSEERTVAVGEDAVRKATIVPVPENISGLYFLSLELRDSSGDSISENFYWLSTKMDEPAWNLTQWHYTPTREFADFTALDDLPEVELVAKAGHSRNEAEGGVKIELTNPSDSLAFMVKLRLLKPAMPSESGEVLPVYWEDNYFPIMPGGERTVEVSYPLWACPDGDPWVEVSGWNVKPFKLGD